MEELVKLTDTMLIILSEAAKRDDRAVVLPARLHGAAASKVVTKLISGKLLEEIPSRADLPVWRRDEDERPLSLVITDGGLAAIGVAPDDAGTTSPVAPKGRRSRSAQTRPSSRPATRESGAGPSKPTATPVHPSSAAVRASSKTAQLIGLLTKPKGATIDEISKALSWLPHTTRAAFTGLRKRGYSVEHKRADSGTNVFRIVGQPASKGSTTAVGKPKSVRGPR